MSTHATITIKDGDSSVDFFRGSDGYPSEAMKTLTQFLNKVKSKEIRAVADQSAGWLVIIGHEEYAKQRAEAPYTAWKVGAYEPIKDCNVYAVRFHYEIDLVAQTITCWEYDELGSDEKKLVDLSLAEHCPA